MEILLVNKYFFPRAGAETAFIHTRDLLRERGHRVLDFSTQDERNMPSDFADYFAPHRSYDNDRGSIRRVKDGASAVYSFAARRALGGLLSAHRPAVAHLHNVYHQLTLSVVDELWRRRIPIVQTLHDYKIACPAYTLFTEGAPCRRCVHGTVANAVKHRCVRGSRPASALAAVEAGLARRRGTYDRITRYIAPSEFAAHAAELAGVSRSKIRVLPYFIPDSEIVEPKSAVSARPAVFFFGGRLTDTKGVRQMLAAFEHVGEPAVLRIAGWGPLQDEVERAAAANPRVEFMGPQPRARILEEIEQSRALLLPSVWEDNCPLVLLEAQSRGTPVIASDRGGPPEFVRDGIDGFVVDPDDILALAERMRTLTQDPDLAEAVGAAGRERMLAVHREEQHYAALLETYAEAADSL